MSGNLLALEHPPVGEEGLDEKKQQGDEQQGIEQIASRLLIPGREIDRLFRLLEDRGKAMGKVFEVFVGPVQGIPCRIPLVWIDIDGEPGCPLIPVAFIQILRGRETVKAGPVQAQGGLR